MAIVSDTLNSIGIRVNRPEKVVFLTGAGISAPDPTQFPLGNELHRLLLKTFTNLSDLQIDSAIHLQFEKSCESLYSTFQTHQLTHAVNLFWNLLSELFIWRATETWKQPNELHTYFREHIRSGGCHITANIDQFIELDELHYQTFTTKGIDDGEHPENENGFLYKFHGDCTKDFVGEQGFLFDAISRGFSANVRRVWDDLLGSAELVVVCGYAGLDTFDVTPYFAGKAAGTFRSSVLWVLFGDQPLARVGTSGSPDIEMIVSKFHSGAFLKGRAGDVLNELLPGLSTIHQMTRTGDFRNECRNLFSETLRQYSARFRNFDAYKQMAGDDILRLIATP